MTNISKLPSGSLVLAFMIIPAVICDPWSCRHLYLLCTFWASGNTDCVSPAQGLYQSVVKAGHLFAPVDTAWEAWAVDHPGYQTIISTELWNRLEVWIMLLPPSFVTQCLLNLPTAPGLTLGSPVMAF